MSKWLLILFIMPLIAKGQNSDSLRYKWLVGVSFESNLSYRQLQYSGINQYIGNERNSDEIPKFGFNAGLNIRYQISSKWCMDGGIIYANRGYATREEELIWFPPNSSYPTKSKSMVSYHYIEIPVKVNYNFRIGRGKFYITAGVSLNNFTNKTTTLVVYQANGEPLRQKDQSNYGYQQDTYSVLLGLGVTIPVAKKIFLNIEPIYRQNFTSIMVDNTAREYFYSIGLNTRLLMGWKKKMGYKINK